MNADRSDAWERVGREQKDSPSLWKQTEAQNHPQFQGGKRKEMSFLPLK